MKLKNVIVTTCFMAGLLAVQSIKAEIVYCPSFLICDNAGICNTDETNGFSNWHVNYSIPRPANGLYRLTMAFGSTRRHLAPGCLYSSGLDGLKMRIESHNTYYPTGPNWNSYHECGGSSSQVFIMPQTCAFTTIEPMKE